jgi:hypothetical protein
MMNRRSFISRASASAFMGALGGRGRASADVPSSALEALRKGIRGRLISPQDRDYETSRRVVSFNPSTDKHPLLIVRCKSADDVARAFDFARTSSLDVAIRDGRIRRGELLLLEAFGGGFTWGSALIRY